MKNQKIQANNLIASVHLLSPACVFALGFVFHIASFHLSGLLSVLFFSLFFTQCFILLHECGHLNFFKNRNANYVFGHIFGFLSFIPFFTWVHMHNLHHKWTGWRDLDPTTEPTVAFKGGNILRFIINFCWLLFIPVFFISYKLGNYWNLSKIRKYVPQSVFRKAIYHVTTYLILYSIGIYFFPSVFLKIILPSFLLSLVWKELIIMTQHTHISIPVSQGKEVKPIKFREQVVYTRSFKTPRFLGKYFLFNFNLHEAHHAFPGMPAYFLNEVKIENARAPHFFEWLTQSKAMKGEDYIFKTSKQTGKDF